MKPIYIELLTALVALISTILALFWGKKERAKRVDVEQQLKQKTYSRIVSDELSDFFAFNSIKNAVDELFEKAEVERFLILVAVNGKQNFNFVSVIYEQHKESKHNINAIARYKNITIDIAYKDLLKKAESEKILFLNVDEMGDGILKNIYQFEGVKHSIISFLTRKSVDKNNDVIVYSSLARYESSDFTEIDKTLIQLSINSIITPTINKIVDRIKS